MEIKRKMPLFWKVLLISCGALIIIAAVLLAVFWGYLASYQLSLPETALNNLIYDRSTLEGYIASSLSGSVSPYERVKDVAEKLTNAVHGSDVCFVKDYDRYTNENPAYIIVRDMKRYATVRLAPGGECGFGFHVWDIESVEILPEVLSPAMYSAEIIVPEGSTVKVGGVILDKAQFKSIVEYPFLCKYQKSSVGRPMCDKYVIKGLIGEIKPMAVLNGISLEYSVDGDTFVFGFPDKMVHSMRITAPENALIYLGDSLISPDSVEVGRYEGTDYDRGADGMPEYAVYMIDGLIGDVKASAELGGIMLDSTTDENGVAFDYPDGLKYEVRVTVPDGAVLMLNGNEVGRENIERTFDDPALVSKSYTGYIGEIPKLSTYVVSGLYAVPKITAELDGDECVCRSEKTDGHTVTAEFGYPESDDMPKEIADAVDLFARSFMYYTARGHVGVDANLKNALSHTFAYSEAYSLINGSYIGVKFNDCYDLRINTLKASGYTALSPDCVRVTLDFDTNRVLYIYEQHDEGRYDIVLVRSGGKWLVADFTIVA